MPPTLEEIRMLLQVARRHEFPAAVDALDQLFDVSPSEEVEDACLSALRAAQDEAVRQAALRCLEVHAGPAGKGMLLEVVMNRDEPGPTREVAAFHLRRSDVAAADEARQALAANPEVSFSRLVGALSGELIEPNYL